jgi:hypothetical protein
MGRNFPIRSNYWEFYHYFECRDISHFKFNLQTMKLLAQILLSILAALLVIFGVCGYSFELKSYQSVFWGFLIVIALYYPSNLISKQ